jgi:DNA polymerase III epsilon subunit-like protein
MKILAIDYEGSHRNPRQGCPVQLGVAVMESGKVLAEGEWLIKPPVHYKTGKPTREVDAYALRVSGLDLDVIERDGLTSRECCETFESWVSDNEGRHLPVIAFNISYDVECYGNMLFDGGGYDRYAGVYKGYPEILGPKWICAYRWARRAIDLESHSLDSVSGHFGLSRNAELHGAREDAILAGHVFFRLTESCRPAEIRSQSA